MASTFAPPTGPPIAPSTPPHGIEPTPATAPGGRRRPFALAAAVVAVIALGVGAFVALSGGRSGSDGGGVEPYSLIAAAESTITAPSVQFDLGLSVSDLAEMSVSGVVDNESGIVSVTTDLSSLLALGDTPMPFDGGAITVLLDASEGVLYLDASALGGLLPSDAAWLSIDLGMLAEQSGQSLDDLQGEFALDPTDIASTLLDAGDPVEVGIDTIDGVEARHVQVAVDVAAALAAVPQAQVDPALGELELPDTVVYDVWVTEDNQLRRVTFDIEVAGQAIEMQLDMTTSSEPLDLQLPDPSEVFDLTDLLGL